MTRFAVGTIVVDDETIGAVILDGCVPLQFLFPSPLTAAEFAEACERTHSDLGSCMTHSTIRQRYDLWRDGRGIPTGGPTISHDELCESARTV